MKCCETSQRYFTFSLHSCFFLAKEIILFSLYCLLILTGALQFIDHSSIQEENFFLCFILLNYLILPHLTLKSMC